MYRGPAALLLFVSSVFLGANPALAQPAPKPGDAAPPPAGQPAPAPKPAAPAKPGAAPPKPAQPAPAKPAAPAKPGAAPAPAEPPEEPAPAEPEEEEEPAELPPAPAPPTGTQPTAPPTARPLPMWPQPGADAAALEKQGTERPTAGADAKRDPDQIYAEDWWSHARPIFEIHGYYRLRAELFHNFSLGRVDPPGLAIWPMPADNAYAGANAFAVGPDICTPDEAGIGDSDDPDGPLVPCKNKTQAGANMRFRLAPELHVSDNLRVLSQIDLLDNLVLGSTPEGYANQPSEDGGYAVVTRGGYTSLGVYDTTQAPPSAGINSYRDSIRVKRAWAEYLTPVGQLRFGRMPNHWGLGILVNSGDGYDDDYQSTVDRITFITGIKALDLYFAGAWDFPNEGATNDTLSLPQAQPYDVAQLDDVDQYVLVIMRRQNPDLLKLSLAKGDLVVNGGTYIVYRKQLLANDSSGPCGAPALGCDNSDEAFRLNYARRGAEAWIPDLWFQLLYRKFRFEFEAVAIRGTIESVGVGTGGVEDRAPGDNDWKIEQYGIATEIAQKLVEDRLKLEFKFGWASGDPDVIGQGQVNPLSPGNSGLQLQRGDDTFSTFRFHPNYKVDLILNRNLLNRIQGVYYFRPSVEYDFVRNPNGQRFGGNFAAIWTRASQFVQTPGHARDLGVELDASLYFQSKDGALNDDPDKMGGFFAMLQYGVLFPLSGLDFQPGEAAAIVDSVRDPGGAETSTAQILRMYLGVHF